MKAKTRARIHPRLESLETRALLTVAASLDESALITLGDVIAYAGKAETVPLRLTADRLTPAAVGRTLLEIKVQPTADSPFRAGRLQLIDPSGEVVKVSRIAQGRAVVARARLAPGDYLLRVRGRGESSGAFVARVRMVADLDGDRQVDRKDLDLFKAWRSRSQTARPFDLSGDGRIDWVDRSIVRRNLGATSNTITVQAVNNTGDANGQNQEFSNSQVHIAVYGEVPDLVDATHNPDGWAYFDSTGTAHSLWGPNGALMTIPTFTLADAPNGIELPKTQVVVSGQVYFGVGAPPVLHVNSGVTGLTVTNGGSGYTASQPPTVVLGGGTTATATLGATVTSIYVVDGGSGYTTPPKVQLVGGGGSGATATAQIAGGQVESITITSPGSGYSLAPQVMFTDGDGVGANAITVVTGGVKSIAITYPGGAVASVPKVTLSGGGGTGATAQAKLTSGAVAGIVLENSGSGYGKDSQVILTGGGGSGAEASISWGAAGNVTSITVTKPGSGYNSAPTLSITGGSGAVAQALIGSVVTAIDVVDPGSGYTAPPTVFVSDGGGATATATVDNGTVKSLSVTNTGNNYSSPPIVTLVGGGGSGAAATSTVAILGVAAPSPSNASDPGNHVYWDFAEFTLNSPTNPDNINADLSQVDLIGIPHTLQVVSRDGTKSPIRGVYPARDDIFSDYASFLAAQNQPDFLPLRTETGFGNHGPFRILAPSDYVLRHLGDSPLPPLATYYDDYIRTVFTVGNTVTYEVPTPAPTTAAIATATLQGDGVESVSVTNVGGGYLFVPEVTITGGSGTGAVAEAILDPTTGTITKVKVIQLGKNYSAPLTVIFKDPVFQFQGTVTPLPDNGPVVYQFTRQGGGDATSYNIYSPLNPPSWTQPRAFATWMVLANGGVFSDSQQQYPNDPARAAILANIENQLVSSMSRGVAVTPGPFYPKGGVANWYAAFLHQTTTTIGGYAYGFAYDDQGGNSTDLSVNKPRKLILKIGWQTALPTS